VTLPISLFDISPTDDELNAFIAGNEQLRQESAEWASFLKEWSAMDEAERKKYHSPQDCIREFRDRVKKAYEYPPLPPLSKEEIETAFTADNLSRLSLQEYIKLLRKVPSRFVTHITRHGFCDSTSHHHWDTKPFHHGFEGLLQKKQIQSVSDQIAEGVWDRNKVQSMLSKIGIPKYYQTKSETLDRLSTFLDYEINPWIKSEFADNNAVHGAIDHVADVNYGSEIGNQIFMLYPAAFIASQYECADQNFNVPDGFWLPPEERHDDRNDIWMMKKSDKRGVLPLDAGIVFIPANARVKPETGSKYEIGGDGLQLEGKPLTTDSISSQEYWEKYFEKIGYRPSKVIYYDEEDPNKALSEFRQKAHLPDKLHREIDLTDMFSENMLGQLNMKDALSEQREIFRGIAKELIDEYYPS